MAGELERNKERKTLYYLAKVRVKLVIIIEDFVFVSGVFVVGHYDYLILYI